MKRTWKRISLFLLAAVLLAGCGTGKPAEDADTTGSAADRSLPVTALASYSIVYAEEGLNEALYRELQILRNTLRERFGATLPVRNADQRQQLTFMRLSQKEQEASRAKWKGKRGMILSGKTIRHTR